MSFIKIPLHFEGSLGEKTGYSLFDSGASFSCVTPEFLENVELAVKMHRPLEIATAAAGSYL